MARKLPDFVDVTRWDPDRDRNGKSLAPGDYVIQPLRKRNASVRGYVYLSDRQWTYSDLSGDDAIGQLVIKDDDGDVWEVTNKCMKIKPTISSRLSRLSKLVHQPSFRPCWAPCFQPTFFAVAGTKVDA